MSSRKIKRGKDIEDTLLEYEKRKKRKKIILIILIFVLVLILIFFAYKFYKRNDISKKINKNISIEYGEELTLEYILKDKFKKVKVNPKLNSLKKVGTY